MASVTGGAVDVASPITTDQLRENGGNYRLASGAVRRVAVLHDEEVAERGIIEGLTTPVYIVEESDPLVALRGVEGGSAMPLCVVDGGSNGFLATPVIIVYGSYGGSMRIQDSSDGPGTMGVGFNERALVWLQDPGAFQAVGYLVLQPPEFTAVAENYNKVKITITKPPIGHFDGYILDRYNPEEGQLYFDYSITDVDKGQSEFYDEDIPNDSTYQYQVRTFMYDEGNSIRIPSAPTPLTDPITIINMPAPGVPTDFSVTQTGLIVQISLTLGDYTQAVILERSDDGGSTWPHSTDHGDATSITEVLDASGTYKYRMYAYNQTGNSGYTDTSTIIFTATTPAAPTGISTSIQTGESWGVYTTLNLSGDYLANEYRFEFSTDGGSTYNGIMDNLFYPSTSQIAVLINFPAGNIKIRARVTGPGGDSSWYVSASIPISYLDGCNSTIGAVTNTTIEVSWDTLAPYCTTHKIINSPDSNTLTGTVLATISYPYDGYPLRYYNLTGLTPNTTYWIRVRVDDPITYRVSYGQSVTTRND